MKFAIIGAGNIAEYHARAINSIEGVEISAVFSRSIEKAIKFANKFGGMSYDDYEKLLENKEINIVDIVTPNSTHTDFAMKAVEKGKHVIVEKPIDTSFEKAKQLVERARNYGVKLSVISQKRFSKNFKKLKSNIGNINSGNLSLKYNRPKEYFSGWRGSKELSGGGVLITNVIHYIDLLRWLLGEIDYVDCKTENIFGLEVEDKTDCSIIFKNGAKIKIHATICAENGKETIRLTGDGGDFKIEDGFLVKNFIGKFKTLIPKRFYYKNKLVKEFKGQFLDFISAIKNNREPLVNGAEGLKDLLIIKALYRSAENNKKVRLK